jgi:hypothetical protein
MRSTPELPLWIRHAAIPGYVAAHALCPAERRLFGTESFYGDWDAQVLLLAKDFAPSSYVRQRIDAGTEQPYSHEPRLRTNRRLGDLVRRFLPVGVLYGSALTNLLRDDGNWSGNLPNRAGALAYGAQVLKEFVLPNMRADVLVLCLGAEAWECSCAATGQVGEWSIHRDSGRTLGNLIAAFHPAARVSHARQVDPWSLLSALVK